MVNHSKMLDGCISPDESWGTFVLEADAKSRHLLLNIMYLWTLNVPGVCHLETACFSRLG